MNKELRKARLSSKKTQLDVALEADTTLRNYQRIEYGQTPSAGTGNLIARAVGSTTEKLFPARRNNDTA